MGIPVHCPNGHEISASRTSTLAGDPYCGQVVVRVPNVLAPEVQNAYTQACREEKRRAVEYGLFCIRQHARRGDAQRPAAAMGSVSSGTTSAVSVDSPCQCGSQSARSAGRLLNIKLSVGRGNRRRRPRRRAASAARTLRDGRNRR